MDKPKMIGVSTRLTNVGRPALPGGGWRLRADPRPGCEAPAEPYRLSPAPGTAPSRPGCSQAGAESEGSNPTP